MVISTASTANVTTVKSMAALDLQVGDTINYIKVLDGLQNLQTSKA